MTTLLFLLSSLLMPMDDSDQLQTYIRPSLATRGSLINASCEVYPKNLMVGDLLYVKVTAKNISGEALEYLLSDHTLSSDSFIFGPVSIMKNSSDGFGLGNSCFIKIYEPPAGIPMPAPPKKKILQPDEMIAAGPQPVFLPSPDEYDIPFWLWDDSAKEEKMLLSFSTMLRIESDSISMRTGANAAVQQELKILPRSESELQLIKEWYDKTRKFRNFRSSSGATVPTPAEWREFEEKLTPGTLRNHIRMIRTLVEIPLDENDGKRQQLFDEMLEWIDGLPPLEKEALTNRAYEIVRGWGLLGTMITLPKKDE